MKLLIRLFSDDEGVTLIEYSLIAALLALAVFASAQTLGDTLVTFFEDAAGKLQAIASGGG